MNKRQKITLIKFISIIVLTLISVVAMVHIKVWVNHSEAMRSMENLSRIVLQYRKDNGSVPSESYVNNIKENLEGHPRLGELHYRAIWIDLDSTPDEILAYTERNSRSWLLEDGCIILRLDGRVEWIKKQTFEKILAQQQSPSEIQAIKSLKGTK